jgi:acetate kinase
MKSALPCVLTINGSSSSIRFAVYEAGETPRRRLDGKIDRIGLSGTNLIVNDSAGKPQVPRRFAAADHRTAAGFLLGWLEAQPVFASVKAAGHRVVHGMKHCEPERVTPKLLAEQRQPLTTKVKAAIFNEPSLKSSEINVETFKGTVQLSGFVKYQADISKAVQVVRSVNGVKSVKNDMRLK